MALLNTTQAQKAKTNAALRVVVPIVVMLIGLGAAAAMFVNSTNKSAPTTTPQGTAIDAPSVGASAATTTAGSATPAAGPATAAVPALTIPPAPSIPTASTTSVPTASTSQGSNATPVAPLKGLRAKIFPVQSPLPLGDIKPGGSAKVLLTFSDAGAGIASLDLADHFETIKRETHIRPQQETRISAPDGSVTVLAPFAALAIEVNRAQPGQVSAAEIIALATARGGSLWRATGKLGGFEAFIQDATGEDIIRIERQYVLSDGGLALTLVQRAFNLTATPMTIRWFQTGPVELPSDPASYGGEKRRLRFGFLLPPDLDPSRATVLSNEFWITRDVYVGKRDTLGRLPAQITKWPNPQSTKEKLGLVWTAMTNRYFGVAIYALDPSLIASPTNLVSSGTILGPTAPKMDWVGSVDRIVLDRGPKMELPALRLESVPLALPAGGSADFSHGIYAGPLSRLPIKAEPALKQVGMPGLVVYNFGGMCGFCTFPFMTSLLLWLMVHLHNWVFLDWALSIIFLVVIVRTTLHPITRWSQIRMARFGKQMQAIGPKQKLLQEKFKDDPKKIQSETAKLWGEEGISPAGLLGCIPMFLQTPVWIALYALLYFAVELRHEGGFFGVFQSIIPSGTMMWSFLGDLSEADRLVYFGRTIVTLPMLGEIRSFNLLPILLGVVFYIQQKYMTPPTTGLNPEQEMQQKIVKWMMVFLFPVFMYNAPSGLAIYFIANSSLGILESKWIRAHMEKKGLLDVEKMRAEALARRTARKNASPTSLMGRLQARIEQAQKMAQSQGQRSGPAAKKVQNMKDTPKNTGPKK